MSGQPPDAGSWLGRLADASKAAWEAKGEPLTVREGYPPQSGGPADVAIARGVAIADALRIASEGRAHTRTNFHNGNPGKYVGQHPSDDYDAAVDALVASVATLAEGLRQEQLRHQAAETEVASLRGELDLASAEAEDAMEAGLILSIDLAEANTDRHRLTAEVTELRGELRDRSEACARLADQRAELTRWLTEALDGWESAFGFGHDVTVGTGDVERIRREAADLL